MRGIFATHLLLGQLQGALVTAHTEQLAQALLIGSQAADLADHRAHELDALAKSLRGVHWSVSRRGEGVVYIDTARPTI